jgi:hypothetical protein
MTDNNVQQNSQLQSLVEMISQGTGDYKSHIENIIQFGEDALDALLNAKPTHIENQRHFRDSIQDLQGAFLRVAEVNLSKAAEIFREELQNPKDDSSNRIVFLASVFSELYHDDLLPIFAKGIKHRIKWVRWLCCESLYKSKSPKALPVLSIALTDRAELVKICAIEAMGDLGTSEYLPKLVKLSKSKNKKVRHNAEKAISLIKEREQTQ